LAFPDLTAMSYATRSNHRPDRELSPANESR
jgi:hypothetical protein